MRLEDDPEVIAFLLERAETEARIAAGDARDKARAIRREKAERVRAALLADGMAPCAAEACRAVVDPAGNPRCQRHQCPNCGGAPAYPWGHYCSGPCFTEYGDRLRARWHEEWERKRRERPCINRVLREGYTDADMANLDPFGRDGVCLAAYGE